MKNCKLFWIAVTALALAACTPKAQIKGTIEGAPSDKVVVKLLDLNNYTVLDTLKTDASGNYACKVELEKGQPEFVYLYHGDTKIASLLLQAGDKVTVKSDLKGNYSVEGSEESQKLQQVDKDYNDFLASVSSMTETADVAKAYVDYYRQCLRYISTNPFSLTVVPVLFQTFGENAPVFSQNTDALRFRAAADSLLKVYPDSKYVKALSREADSRLKIMDLSNRIDAAAEVGFMDMELPDVKGNKVKLSSVDAKVIFLYFWTSQHTGQTLFNLEFLKPVYDEFHSKGLEIYAVCVDLDKALWASVVKNQDLKWINVNDGLGAASPVLPLYNVGSVPALYIIEDGNLSSVSVSSDAELRNYLKRVLK